MTVQICPDKDAACGEFPVSVRCANCPTLKTAVQPAEPPLITALINSRRERYAMDQTCTPAFLHWIDTQARREGVGANEAWNAGYACADAIAKPVQPAEPYAYAIYFPDQQREELVHDIDDACEDMTNDGNHVVTPLYEHPVIAQPEQPASIPTGMCLMPISASSEMIDAAMADNYLHGDPEAARIVLKDEYRAMVAAHQATQTALPDAGMDSQKLIRMRSAFMTCTSCGPEKLYELRFAFPSLPDMQAAHHEWLMFTGELK